MVTRRVNGPLFITCGNCGAKYGPFREVRSGNFKCSRCNKVFYV